MARCPVTAFDCLTCDEATCRLKSRMTDTPADPIAAEAREIAARVLTEHFEAELNRSPSDPIGARTRLTDRMAAAFGHRMKSAGRAEASAWRQVAKAPLGEWGLLWHPSWRRPFPGLVTGELGRCWVDTCEPIASGWETFATHWRPQDDVPLPPPPEGGES